MKWLKMLLDMLKSIRKDMVEQEPKPKEEEPKVEEPINPKVTISGVKPTNDIGKDCDVWMTYEEV